MFNIQNSLPQAKIWIKMYRCRQCDFRFLHFIPGVACYNSIRNKSCNSTDLEVEMSFWVEVEAITELDIQTRIDKYAKEAEANKKNKTKEGQEDPWYQVLEGKIRNWGELFDGNTKIEFNKSNLKTLLANRKDVKNMLMAAIQSDTIFGLPNREEFEGNSDGPGSTSRNGKRRTGQKTAGNAS